MFEILKNVWFLLVIVIILIIASVAAWTQIYFILKERGELKIKFEAISAKANSLIEENRKVKSEIEYFSVPENLEKELKSKYNYKQPDEKMIIVVP